MPNDLLEAASIDGCGPVKTFFTVVLPISGTVYATIFILDFVAHWNDFMWPLLVVTGEEKRTIQLAIQTFFGSKPINYGPIMASLTISAIPMLIMFLCIPFHPLSVNGCVVRHLSAFFPLYLFFIHPNDLVPAKIFGIV